MNSEQRKNHLFQVQCVPVCDSTSPIHSLTPSELSTSTPQLSVTAKSAAEIVNVPLTCLQGIWEKVKRLICTTNAITPAPGQEPEARMVLSCSGNVPHMVVPKKRGEFICDAKCPNWKAMGICSHNVVVAEVNKKLPLFLPHKKRKKGVIVTKLLTTTMPKGRGRKGGVSARVRTQARPVMTRIGMNALEDAPSEPSATPHPYSSQTPIDSCGSSTTPHPYSFQTLFHSSGTSATPHPYGSQTPFHPSGASTIPHPCGSQTPFDPSGSSAIPYHSQDSGSAFMCSPQSNVVQSPMNFYGPYHYTAQSPYYQGMSNQAINPSSQYYRPSLPFTLCFITGNIRVCIGCRNTYPKSPKPPHDLCIRHEEWREFTSPNTSKPPSKFGNVYYHCRKECIWMLCPSFTSSELYVSPEMQLSSVHKDFILSVFGITV